MKVTMTDTVKFDYGKFKKGESYELPDELGQYFVNCEWAEAEGVESTGDRTAPVQFSVDKDNAVTEHKDAEGNPVDALHTSFESMRNGKAFDASKETGSYVTLDPRIAPDSDTLVIQDSFGTNETEV